MITIAVVGILCILAFALFGLFLFIKIILAPMKEPADTSRSGRMAPVAGAVAHCFSRVQSGPSTRGCKRQPALPSAALATLRTQTLTAHNRGWADATLAPSAPQAIEYLSNSKSTAINIASTGSEYPRKP